MSASESRVGVRSWTRLRDAKARRIAALGSRAAGRLLRQEAIVSALETLIQSFDRVALEGNNQKQADFLSRALVRADPRKLHDIHLLISTISRPEHLTLFERGIARKLDFSFAGPQSLRVAQLLEDGKLEIGAIYTYVELYARMFVDLTPQVALVCAEKADAQGNLYTGANTEDTPTIVEATAFRHGIVIAQVNELVGEVPRVDIPGSWVDFVVVADKPFAIEPLFTRDPRHITELQLLTYGESLGLKGKICRNWALNPHPTLIPAIESGWVESVHCFGSEVGMEEYIRARPDIFFVGRDGSLRSNRVLCQLAGQYGVDLFIGSTLQMDADANSSTVTLGRLAGFGGAPNMGHDPRGRRHSSAAWLKLMKNDGPNNAIGRGHKLVVQTAETFKKGGEPTIVDALDAIAVGKQSNMPIAPVMIYGDDVSHVVTEEGIAYLHAAEGVEERRAALRAVAGVTPVGMRADPVKTAELRRRGIVAYPEDLGIRRGEAKRSVLAARSIDDLVAWSGGLYEPPAKFRGW